MPITVNGTLATEVIKNPPLQTVDIMVDNARKVARYHGGSKDGQVEAIQEVRPAIAFPVAVQAYWAAADATDGSMILPYQTERYYAQGRTITVEPSRATRSAATTTTITIDYVAASTNAIAVTGGANNQQHWYVDSAYAPLAPLTPEQQAARARAAVRSERRKTLAHKRARRLLLNLLSDEQQQEYAQSKCFTVVAKNGKVFRLRKGKTAELLGSDGVALAAYCIHLPYGYNAEDTLVALLLSLQTDPAEFERVANVTQLKRPMEMVQDMTVSLRGAAVAMREAGQAARHAAEHVRESQAMLRAEGLSNAEVDALRQWPNRHDGLLVMGQAA